MAINGALDIYGLVKLFVKKLIFEKSFPKNQIRTKNSIWSSIAKKIITTETIFKFDE